MCQECGLPSHRRVHHGLIPPNSSTCILHIRTVRIIVISSHYWKHRHPPLLIYLPGEDVRLSWPALRGRQVKTVIVLSTPAVNHRTANQMSSTSQHYSHCLGTRPTDHRLPANTAHIVLDRQQHVFNYTPVHSKPACVCPWIHGLPLCV